MKVLHCIPTLGVGGAERQLVHLVRSMAPLGIESHVAFSDGGPHADALRDAGATLHPLPHRSNYDPRTIGDIRRVIDAVRPDVVQSWLPRMDFLAGAAALTRRVPWVLSERTSGDNYPPNALNRIREFLGRRAAAIVSCSRGGEEYWLGRGAREVHLVPNCVVTPERGGEPRDASSIVLVGRLSVEKNIPLVLEAMRSLDGVTLTICGDGPLRPEIERRIAELGIADRVTLAGWVPDVSARLQRAAAVVSASRFEGRPNAVLEAMACGCPLVVSDIAAHRELLDDETATFFPPKPDAIANAIRNVLGDRAAAERKAARAQEIVAEWTPDAVARRYRDVYLRVTSR